MKDKIFTFLLSILEKYFAVMLHNFIVNKLSDKEIPHFYPEIMKKVELSPEPYVVYFTSLYPEVYVCSDGESALKLVKLYENLNMEVGRNNIKIIYGKADFIFQFKIPKLMDLIFTWDATKEEKDKVFDRIIEAPMKVR